MSEVKKATKIPAIEGFNDAKTLQEMTERTRHALNKHFAENIAIPEGTVLTQETAKVGQKIFLKTLGKNAYVISVNNSDITIRMGILKMNVEANDCILVASEPHTVILKRENKPNSTHQLFMTKNTTVKQDVDLRGLMVNEALPIIDKAIDDAFLTGVNRLRIIHGKGTGALKAGVIPYLQKHKMVNACQEAAIEEGGAGVTIITLK